MKIEKIDHIVFTANDIEKTIQFYTQILEMELVEFGEGRKVLKFGEQKINLHQFGKEFAPHAKNPTCGGIDVCLITKTPIHEIVETLEGKQ